MTIPLTWRVDGAEDAPPLVLLNSVGSSTAMWEPCLAPLIERFRVIRIDTRGHGDSRSAAGDAEHDRRPRRADVLAALDALGLDRVPIAGLSLGGMVGMWIAIHRPERVSRLALLCTSARLDPGLWQERAAAVRADGMAAIAEAAVARWIRPVTFGRDPALHAGLVAMMCAVDAESYAQCGEAIAAMDQRADLPRIAAPTLVIGAHDDPATPPAHQRLLAEQIPGARLELLDEASHLATFEQPARVAALLVEHFGERDALSAGYEVRREVLGDEYVDAALANSTPLTGGFQDFLTRYAWGGVWTGPELSRRERSIATLAALVTLGAEHELAAHVHGALRNGLTPDEVIAVLTHLSVYAGMPRANRAVAIARGVLEPG